MNTELAQIIRAAQRRIYEKRVLGWLYPDVYEPIRRAYWMVLIERYSA